MARGNIIPKLSFPLPSSQLERVAEYLALAALDWTPRRGEISNSPLQDLISEDLQCEGRGISFAE